MNVSKMWVHYCRRDHDLVFVERGCECNWCGAKAQEIPAEKAPARLGAKTVPVKQFVAEAA